MFNLSSSKKRSTSDDDFCEDDWDWSCDWEKDSKKNDCGCNVSINIYCNKCKKDNDFSDSDLSDSDFSDSDFSDSDRSDRSDSDSDRSDNDFECMSKKKPVYSDGKCNIYVNVYCNS